MVVDYYISGAATRAAPTHYLKSWLGKGGPCGRPGYAVKSFYFEHLFVITRTVGRQHVIEFFGHDDALQRCEQRYFG